MAGLRGNSAFRGYVPEEERLISVLESDSPLPDDDPKTRRGGLIPSRKGDLEQINMYATLRQQGAISDKAWRRLIQRNPGSAVLFSSVQPDPSVSTARSRQEIGSRYFNPGREAVPFETTEEQEFGLPPLKGNIAQEAVAPKADIEGAILEALNRGDIDLATKLGYGSGAKDEFEGSILFDKNGNTYRATKSGTIRPVKVEGGAKIAPPIFPFTSIDPTTGQPIQSVISRPEAARRSEAGISNLGPSVPLKALPKDAADALAAAPSIYRSLDVMERVTKAGKTGRVTGLGSEVQAFFGTDKDAVDFKTARTNFQVQAQAIIKGIPSNFDIQTITKTFADLTAPESVNQSRIDFSRKSMDDLLRANISYYKGQGFAIPRFVLGMAKRRRIDPDSVPEWDGESVLGFDEKTGFKWEQPGTTSGQPPSTLSETERARLEELRKKQSAR